MSNRSQSRRPTLVSIPERDTLKVDLRSTSKTPTYQQKVHHWETTSVTAAGEPRSPTLSVQYSNISAFNFHSQHKPRINKEDIARDIESFDILLDCCKRFEDGLKIVAEAGGELGAILDRFARCKALEEHIWDGEEDEELEEEGENGIDISQGFQTIAGLQHVLSCQHRALAGLVKKSLFEPLNEAFVSYRSTIKSLEVTYKDSQTPLLRTLRTLQAKSLSKFRSLPLIRSNLQNLTLQLDALEDLKLRHYASCLAVTRSTWSKIYERCASVLGKGEIEILETVVGKKEMLTNVLEGAHDPWLMGEDGTDKNEIYSSNIERDEARQDIRPSRKPNTHSTDPNTSSTSLAVSSPETLSLITPTPSKENPSWPALPKTSMRVQGHFSSSGGLLRLPPEKSESFQAESTSTQPPPDVEIDDVSSIRSYIGTSVSLNPVEANSDIDDHFSGAEVEAQSRLRQPKPTFANIISDIDGRTRERTSFLQRLGGYGWRG